MADPPRKPRLTTRQPLNAIPDGLTIPLPTTHAHFSKDISQGVKVLRANPEGMAEYLPLTAQELPIMAALVSESFGMPQDKCELWVQRSGIENWRVLKTSTIEAGLMRIPMAQWFAGRAVSMVGLAGVAVSTAGRGQRLGQQLMRETLQEMWEEGTALSALYGSTTSFYRRVGYERAGSRFSAEVAVRELTSRGGPLEVREIRPEDHPPVEEFQARHVREHAALVRGPYLWVRVRGPRGMSAHGYGFYRNNSLEGYTYLVRHPGYSAQTNTLEATDVVLTTPDALLTFLGLLAGHRALFTHARWPSTPASALLLNIADPWQLKVTLDEHWLLRIVNLQAALQQRGYPDHLQLDLHLQVEDPLLLKNAGRWLLRVCNGKATVEPGGEGRLELDIGALASLYTGFLDAQQLHLAGRARGQSQALQTATTIFGGATPQLADFF